MFVQHILFKISNILINLITFSKPTDIEVTAESKIKLVNLIIYTKHSYGVWMNDQSFIIHPHILFKFHNFSICATNNFSGI